MICCSQHQKGWDSEPKSTAFDCTILTNTEFEKKNEKAEKDYL